MIKVENEKKDVLTVELEQIRREVRVLEKALDAYGITSFNKIARIHRAIEALAKHLPPQFEQAPALAVYPIPSDTREGVVHSVEYVGRKRYRCSCEAYKYAERPDCKHITKVRWGVS